MKPTSKQIDLINSLTEEIGWWRYTDLSHNMVQEFVLHELNHDLTPEQEAHIINGLNKLMYVLKQIE